MVRLIGINDLLLSSTMLVPRCQADILKEKPQYYGYTRDRDVPFYPTMEQVGNAVYLLAQSPWRAAGHTDEEFMTVSKLC